jgi:molybdopterin/thiamine biosynthesis adenylyltransferase/rhodanese-related sulfurtransferase
MDLTNEELKRYSRQMILPEIGLEGQQKLKKAKILVVGAGGLGCPVLQYIVAAGVGTIGIIDNDVVDFSNLHRQILYNVDDIGQPKATVVKQKLQLLNPHIAITAYAERLTKNNIETIFEPYDLIIDGSDNFATRYLVNDYCVSLNKTLVFGSILKFEGQVSVFNHLNGPNYRDVFPEPPADELNNCSEIGVLGVLPGIIGTYMANEAIKVIIGMGQILSGRLMMIDALSNQVNLFNIAKTNQPAPKALQPQIVSIDDSEITQELLNEWLQTEQDKIQLVDIRDKAEHRDFNIGGINIPFYQLQSRLAEIPGNKKLILYCQAGLRSKTAVKLLKSLYKGEVFSLKGGVY